MVIDLKGDSQEMLSSLKQCSQRFGTAGQPIPLRYFSIREDHATFEADTVYDQRDAEGFIKLNALRLRLRKK